jgi:hypothetical protein
MYHEFFNGSPFDDSDDSDDSGLFGWPLILVFLIGLSARRGIESEC